MANDFYNSSGAPGQQSPGSSAAIRAQFSALAQAFDKMPALSGNGGKFTRINDGGTALTASSQLAEIAGAVTASGHLVVGGTTANLAWTTKAVQVNAASALSGWSAAANYQTWVTTNLYNGTTGFFYQTSDSSGAKAYVQSSEGHIWYSAPAGTAATAAPLVRQMSLDSSGNLNFGAASPFGSSALGHLHISSSASGAQLFLRNAASTAGKFWQIGPDGSTNGLVVYNQSNVGVYMLDGTTAWAANSDERIKADLQPITDAAAKVASLRAVTGRYKTDEPGTSRAFLIAQDVQKVLPEAVDVQADDMGTLGVRYTDVIPLLVAALTENTRRVAALEKELARIKAEADLNLPEP